MISGALRDPGENTTVPTPIAVAASKTQFALGLADFIEV
jgi:hypothetical protein